MSAQIPKGHSRKRRARLITWFGRFHGWIYEASDGRLGARLRGNDMALLWTTGRKSGVERRTALLALSQGDEVLVVASFFGSPKHPAWYLNLEASPSCTVRMGRRKFKAAARTAEGQERTDLWSTVTEGWPDFADYEARAGRAIPVVILSPR